MKDKSGIVASFLKQSGWLKAIDSVHFLAAGEYNENYKVITADKSFVFRINHGTQLGLKNQIAYEFNVLKALQNSEITPKPIHCIDKHSDFENGALLMSFIEGRQFRYEQDYNKAADTFCKIHAQRVDNTLIKQEMPILDIASESIGLIQRFQNHPLQKEKKRLMDYYDKVLKLQHSNIDIFRNEAMCMVNTEVNSGNFIVNGKKAYLVDWEKAVVSYRYQDLGHFICPTTTRWKTDFLFDDASKTEFLKHYFEKQRLSIDFEEFTYKTELLVKAILLRALSWCFMAYYEYVFDDRALKNEETFRKIRQYLNDMDRFIS